MATNTNPLAASSESSDTCLSGFTSLDSSDTIVKRPTPPPSNKKAKKKTKKTTPVPVPTETEFAESYPYLYKSMKEGNSHRNHMSKDFVEIMEWSVYRLDKSDLDELEGLWKSQILAEREAALKRMPILLLQTGMVKDLMR